MKSIFVITFSLFFSSIYAQTLSMESAVETALQRHPSIKQAQQQLEILKLNRHASMIGGLPVVAATISDQESYNSVNQELFNGTKIQRGGAASNNLLANVTATTLLYQGGRIQAGMKRLEEQEKQQQDRLDQLRADLRADVSIAYVEAVRLQSGTKLLEEQIRYFQNQESLVRLKIEQGLGRQDQLYSVQMELNNRVRAQQQQNLQVRQAMLQLHRLMYTEPDSMRIVSDSISIGAPISLTEILNRLENNPSLMSLDKQIRINQFLEKEIRTNTYPALRLNTGMNYFRNQNAAGQLLLNQNSGPFVSLGLSIPLYASGSARRAEKISRLQTEQIKVEKENQQFNFKMDVHNFYTLYQQSIEQLKGQTQTVALGKKVLESVMQRFRMGESTLLETIEAQRNLEEASNQVIQLMFIIKTAEIELKRLANLP
jgi:outer membrane protein